MPDIRSSPGVEQKLSLLSTDAQYDLACACGTNDKDRRHRAADGRWLYPVTLPNGGRCVLFKTLTSNVCVNDCRYCPLRRDRDVPRCTLSKEETVRAFLHYLRRRDCFGLFLSSGVVGTADQTMEHLTGVAEILRRRERFGGYIHLKVLPGASDAAIEKAVALSSAVSLNIEAPGEEHFRELSSSKNFMKDIIRPIRLLSRLTARGERYQRVKTSTQFVVGAAGETDRQIVRYAWGLYRRLRFDRVYFSAYQRGLGDPGLPGERGLTGGQALMREHRLYQVDWLIRKYGFSLEDIPFDERDSLSQAMDPKEHWARLHPERFPVDVNRADRETLLRVPGFGEVTVRRILQRRAGDGRIRSMQEIGRPGERLRRAAAYVSF